MNSPTNPTHRQRLISHIPTGDLLNQLDANDQLEDEDREAIEAELEARDLFDPARPMGQVL